MLRMIGAIVLGSAVYGFAIGSVHSNLFAARNLVKFPLLVLTTSAVCAVAYYAFSLLVTRRLSFREVQMLSLGTFRDIVMLLASLAPACLFLAHTIYPPTRSSLGEYPLFLGLNVGLIAASGAAALVRRTAALVKRHALKPVAGTAIISAWLVISLFVGGQCAWYLRPFFGVSTAPAPFMLGRAPDYRGATSIYEAVWNIVKPPPLETDYYTDKYRLRGSRQLPSGRVCRSS
jgi:hypothetical protein